MIIFLAGAAARLIERHRAEVALRASQEQYRSLFNSIDKGFCVIELAFDRTDKAVDFRFVEVNQAFEEQTGLRDVTGKRMGTGARPRNPLV